MAVLPPPMTATFLVFMAIFGAIGIASATRALATSEDYHVASRSVRPWLAALSAVATNNSGYMFVGLIGFAYLEGLAALWVQGGWVAGELVVWGWIVRRLRETTGRTGDITIPSVLADGSRLVAGVAGLLAIVFLATYAAAQLRAGGKALEALLGWTPEAGAWLGAGIVLVYSVAGGIRASIWTDAAQSVVMFAAMGILLGAALVEIGGPAALGDRLVAIDPGLLDWTPGEPAFGFGAWALGFVCAGLGVAGQPHIVVRALALRSPDDVPAARRIYFLWYAPFSLCSIATGLCARALFPDALGFDSELALPRLAIELLPGVLVGLVLAGLFAATMSTADSLILSCSAALSHDLARRPSLRFAKAGTAAATAFALILALAGPESVFVLVLFAWSALATAFAPLLLLRSAGRRPSPGVSIAVMTAGIGTALVWRFLLGWSGDVYEVLPGLVAGFAAYGLARIAGRD